MADKATFSLDSDEPYLSPDERKVVKRLLGHPEDFPEEFWSAVIQKVALDGQPIPQSQVQGLNQLSPSAAQTIVTGESTSSLSFVDLSTVGPQITGLSNGTYLVNFGCQILTAGDVGIMAIQSNTTSIAGTNDAAFAGGSPMNITVSRSVLVILDEANNNTLCAKYAVTAGTQEFSKRWMTALKVGN